MFLVIRVLATIFLFYVLIFFKIFYCVYRVLLWAASWGASAPEWQNKNKNNRKWIMKEWNLFMFCSLPQKIASALFSKYSWVHMKLSKWDCHNSLTLCSYNIMQGVIFLWFPRFKLLFFQVLKKRNYNYRMWHLWLIKLPWSFQA